MADSELIQRVVYIETGIAFIDLKSIFSPCGSIQAMYSWKPQHGGDRIYFFIEFKDASAVERALKITAEGVKVHRLASSPPHLISNFSAIQPMLYLKRSNAQSTNGQNLPGSQAEENSMPVGHKRRRVSSGGRNDTQPSILGQPTKDNTQSNSTASVTKKRTPTGPRRDYPKDPPRASQAQKEKENITTPLTLPSPSQNPPGPAALHPLPLPFHPRVAPQTNDFSSPARAPSFFQLPPPLPPAFQQNSNTAGPPLPANTAILAPPPYPGSAFFQPAPYASSSGQFKYDLQSLPQDPQSVIVNLTHFAAHSLERGKWIAVAAHYKGRGNNEAALAVLSAMVTAMSAPSVGASDADLRPAFLMLSSCHTQLGMRSRIMHGENAEKTRHHFHMAQVYVQRIYGAACVPDNGSLTQGQGIGIIPGCAGDLAGSSGLHETASSGHPAPCTSADPALQDKYEKQVKLNEELKTRLGKLQKEIEALRESDKQRAVRVSAAEASNRRLEDSLQAEQKTRAQMDSEIAKLTLELASVRSKELSAQEQFKKEAVLRRREEQTSEFLRTRLGDASKQMAQVVKVAQGREKNARECFGRLGVLFLKAAKGEGIDPASAAAGLVEVDLLVGKGQQAESSGSASSGPHENERGENAGQVAAAVETAQPQAGPQAGAKKKRSKSGGMCPSG